MRWIQQLFARDLPTPPVLLRVSDESGRPPETVEVEATWFPSGRTLRRSHRTASGLFVVPWLGREDRVRLAIETASGASRLDVRRDRPDGGRVYDLALTRAG